MEANLSDGFLSPDLQQDGLLCHCADISKTPPKNGDLSKKSIRLSYPLLVFLLPSANQSGCFASN